MIWINDIHTFCEEVLTIKCVIRLYLSA